MDTQFDLVVVSHLRWSFVWQRPQQLISRLASHRKVLFVEEPIYVDGGLGLNIPELSQVTDKVTVLKPRIPRPAQADAPVWSNRAAISEQVRYGMRLLQLRDCALWFYTPVPDFLLYTVLPSVVIYDVMDELANFKFAPADMLEREEKMLRRADIVFTGGASLYESKRAYNTNTHLFASGVDEAHYSKACDDGTEVPEYVERIPAPRAVYVGVIDERMDYELIATAAARRPEVQFVMVGPVVKVDPATLPVAPNLHYLGQRDYDELPCILKGGSVCIMPFAMNDATKFISPTKTLEYMATHRPIVSTPIRDVERFYSDIVYLGHDHEEFARQIDAALHESPADTSRRNARESRVLAEHGWDAISANMNRLIEAIYLRKQPAPIAELITAGAARPVRPAMPPMPRTPAPSVVRLRQRPADQTVARG